MQLGNSKTINVRKSQIYLLVLVVLCTALLASCSFEGLFVFQNENNTVKGPVELSQKISEEAESGAEDTVLFLEDVTEEEIKGITENTGNFWGLPTGYTIIKADAGENTLKVRFYIERSNNYYVVKNFLSGEEIPEDQTEALEISEVLKSVIDTIVKDGMTNYEKEIAIHNWLVNEIEYDESIDAKTTDNGSYGAMVSKKTMCRGYAESMKLIAECTGLETELIVGNATDEKGNDVGHAWNLVNLDGKWYHLDATYDDPVDDNFDNIHYYYFNLNDTDMLKDHRWEAEYYPRCNNDSYMYYKKNSLYYADMEVLRNEVTDTLNYDKPKYIEVLVDVSSISDSQLGFIFNTTSVNSFTWSAQSSNPLVLTIMPDYE